MINKKLKLDKNGGPVVFLGSTNAMPMMYALELKNMGFDVIYFVDRPVDDLLNRPENHFPNLKYPYPDWIIEIDVPSQMLVPFTRILFSKYVKYKLLKMRGEQPQVIVLNSLFTSLSRFFKTVSCSIVSLSHGGDLDSWADVEGAEELAVSFSKYSFWKFLPTSLSKCMIKLAVRRQYDGYLNSDVVLYFPLGFNQNGDRVVNRLIQQGVKYIPRFDVSFYPLEGQRQEYKKQTEKLIIFSGVRFTFKNFSEGNEGYNKGNDDIIKGLSLFYKKNKDIEIHFVEKGLDYLEAKRLCSEYGLESVVTWHKEMKFTELLHLYLKSDICFDQVGNHWIGAIGAYSLYLGKPLIANDLPHINSGLWPSDNPIYTACNHRDVYDGLLFYSSETERLKANHASRKFATEYLGPNKVLNELFELES